MTSKTISTTLEIIYVVFLFIIMNMDFFCLVRCFLGFNSLMLLHLFFVVKQDKEKETVYLS